MDQNEALNSINSDLIRGHIDTIILKALQAGDRYGYDIIKEIEHKSDGQYIIKQPTLYSCLKRLEIQGFVKSYWGSKSIGGRKKYFTLTDMGRELFVRNKSDWDYSRSVIDKLISDENYVPYVPEQSQEQSQNKVADFKQDEQNDILNLETIESTDEDEMLLSEDSTLASDDEDYDQSEIIDVLPLEIDDDVDEDDVENATSADDENDEDDELQIAYVEPYKNDYDLDEEFDRRVAEAAAAAQRDEDLDDDNDVSFFDEEENQSKSAEAIPEEEVLSEEENEASSIEEYQYKELLSEEKAAPEPEYIQNDIINGDAYRNNEELPLLTFEQDTVERFASEVEDNVAQDNVAQEEENVPEPAVEEPPEEEFSLSASEQNMAEGLPSAVEEEENQIINAAYYDSKQESYFDNVDNAKYEPPQNNEAIDINSYFTDLDEVEEEEETASTYESQESPPMIITPSLLELSKPEFPDVRKFVRETPPENKTVFYSYKRSDVSLDERSAIIDKEYRSVINKLISDNIVEYKPPKPTDDAPIRYNEVWAMNDEPITRPPTLKEIQSEQQPIEAPTLQEIQSEPLSRPPTLQELQQDVQQEQNTEAIAISEKITVETGDNVELRTHSNRDLQAYNHKHYYYCNQLRLLQYGILFGIMLLEIVLCFYFIEVVHNKMNISNISLAVYIGAVVVAALFPIIAFFMSSSDYNKRKRINYNGKTSALFAVVVFVLLALIVFFANIYGGILINDFNNYLSTLIMPIVLSTNVMTNALIFHLLYTSGRYNVEE